MTEDEAKTKWCPAARSRDLGSEATINRPFASEDGDSIADAECRCIASACMAWRLTKPCPGIVRDGLNSSTREPFAVDDVRPYEGMSEWRTERTEPTGYCGLAGAGR